MQTALTIAGSDSSGGAGIQADLKTFTALGVFGTTAITAVTAQNTHGVQRILAMPADLVTAQIEAVVTDLRPAAVKIGMLASADIVLAVAGAIRRFDLSHIVVDTVMVATGGTPLLDAGAVALLQQDLLPLATVVTANVPEAEALTGLRITSIEDLWAAARQLVAAGARAAIVKGGHLTAGPAVDVLVAGGETLELRADRLPTRHTHGTGCTFAAAIAAGLANGASLADAARAAKAYVTRAIARAPGLGGGHGPLGPGV
jgi:hydroxymethylpyrimidine/phosphomethylpyrimidine kinase